MSVDLSLHKKCVPFTINDLISNVTHYNLFKQLFLVNVAVLFKHISTTYS
jgi:hypothetical protein